MDFLLLNGCGFPLMVLDPAKIRWWAKRRRANTPNRRFVPLSNGHAHYFWDLQRGNPYLITHFPAPASALGYASVQPNPDKLVAELVTTDYIALTQRPDYASDPR